MNKAYIVGNEFIKINGLTYPIKNTFVVGETGVEDNKRKVLFPVVKKLVVKRVDSAWLDDFTGRILECYNTMPWQSESYGRSTAMWLKMTCAYRNFQQWDITDYDTGEVISTSQDMFGLYFLRVNSEGEILGNYVSGHGWDFGPGSGCKGAVVSAATPVTYDTNIGLQNEVYVGSNCDFVSFDVSDTTSGSEDPNEYGWLGAVFHGEWLEKEYRKKDFTMWFYELEYDTGMWQDNYVQGTPNDATFAPGEAGMRIISNKFKYEPWSRYPHLL